MRASQERYPELNQIMGGYFHQDWLIEFHAHGEQPSEEIILSRMVAQKNAIDRRAAVRELEHLLTTAPDEAALEKIIVDDMGAQVDPQLDGRTMRAWLEHVGDLLRESLRAADFSNGMPS